MLVRVKGLWERYWRRRHSLKQMKARVSALGWSARINRRKCRENLFLFIDENPWGLLHLDWWLNLITCRDCGQYRYEIYSGDGSFVRVFCLSCEGVMVLSPILFREELKRGDLSTSLKHLREHAAVLQRDIAERQAQLAETDRLMTEMELELQAGDGGYRKLLKD